MDSEEDPKITDGWETWAFVFGLLPIGVAAIATTVAEWLYMSAPKKTSHSNSAGHGILAKV